LIRLGCWCVPCQYRRDEKESQESQSRSSILLEARGHQCCTPTAMMEETEEGMRDLFRLPARG
jgi:hypothetical protein